MSETKREYEIRDAHHHRERPDLALAEFAAAADEAVGPDLAAILGPLTAAPRRHREDVFNGLAIRSRPLADFGGAEFRMNTGSSDAEVPARLLVHGVREAAQRFVDGRSTVTRIAAEARAAARDAIARHPCDRPAARLAAIGVSLADRPDRSRVTADFEALGHDLTPGVESAVAHPDDAAGLGSVLDVLLASHARRAVLLDEARAAEALGRVQIAALGIAAAAGLGIHVAADMLTRRERLEFTFDRGRVIGALRWDEGVLMGEYHLVGREHYLWRDSLTIACTLPDTLIVALAGRPLGAVVEDRFVPADTPILSSGRHGSGALRVELDMATEWLPDYPF